MSPVDPSLLDKDLAVIRKRRGKDAVRYGDETIPVERIPMQSPTLMRVTDGGIPIGRVTRLWGPPSSGKSHVAYLIIAAAQKMRSKRFKNGLGCCYWNVEGIYDAEHAARLGIDTKKLALEETKIIEDISGEMELLLRSCHLHVVDSASSAKCIDELAGKPEDWHPMIDARAWGRALDRIEARFDNDENVLILIDHAGEKIDMRRRTSYSYAKGGKALEHASSMSLELSAGSWLFYHPDGHLEKDEKIKEECGVSYSGLKEADGFEITVRCKKNRVGRQHRAGRMRLDLNTFQFDYTFELLDAARFFDLDGLPSHRSGNPPIIAPTTDNGSWFKVPGREKAVQGTRGIRECLDADEELRGVILTAMLKGG